MNLPNLEDEHTLVVLAYADAGLGHLRVTNTLYEGLPKTVSPTLLRSSEGNIKSLHRLTSSNPFYTNFLEWSQKGRQEKIITTLYTKLLLRNKKEVMQQLEVIIEQKMHVMRKLVVVCTHFGLAHQLAEIKAAIEKKWEMKMIVAVCVTDDSPQLLWHVKKADIIFVPSKLTKKKLGNSSKIKVIHYPVSPLLRQKLSSYEFERREQQLNPESVQKINVSMPISGAAVGLEFAQKLMKELHRKSERYQFSIVTQDNIFTNAFINKNEKRSYVKILESSHARRVVRLYDKLFLNNVMALEVSKPSEQSFKALFNPKQRGGVIMLFSTPVGRQEYDNLAYMLRNKLIPSELEHEQLYMYALEGAKFSETAMKHLYQKAKHWRGLCLPKEAGQSAKFIHWCLENKIFAGMSHSALDKSDGVERFWKAVDGIL